jgi:hypothetical protein
VHAGTCNTLRACATAAVRRVWHTVYCVYMYTLYNYTAVAAVSSRWRTYISTQISSTLEMPQCEINNACGTMSQRSVTRPIPKTRSVM